MITRDQIRALLRSIGRDAQADDVASLVVAGELVEALAEPTDAMVEAGLRAHCKRSGHPVPAMTAGLAETYRTIWRAMFAARLTAQSSDPARPRCA